MGNAAKGSRCLITELLVGSLLILANFDFVLNFVCVTVVGV